MYIYIIEDETLTSSVDDDFNLDKDYILLTAHVEFDWSREALGEVAVVGLASQFPVEMLPAEVG